MKTPPLMRSFPRCPFGFRLMAAFLIMEAPLSWAQAPAPTAAVAPSSSLSEKKVVFVAEQSVGGNIASFPDGTKAVVLEKSCEANFAKPADACVEWKLPTPLPAGWWHGVAESPLSGTQYSNRGIGIGVITAQKPSVNVEANIVFKESTPQRFEFWIYSSAPVEGLRIQPAGDLWRYNRTWPIRQITLEQVQPSKLTDQDAVTLDLPVAQDGSVQLPMALPPGNYSMTAPVKKEGTSLFQGEDNRTIEVPFPFDRWKRPLTSNFYMASPLRQITLKMDKADATGKVAILLKHNITRPQVGTIVSNDRLTVTVDPSKTETAQLVLIGSGLTGEVPTFPLLPRGQKTAVLTTWDDGKPEDIRCAEILNKHGYHPSFFMNQNSPAMQFLDKLEALNVEVGSHCYHHPSLHAIPPQSAVEECVEMRKVLEKTLKHPVISLGYPNGYSPSYDADGDYVLRAVKAAGYWSGRTTQTKEGNVDSYTDLAAMDTDGFFGNSKPLEAQWEKTRTKEGGVFYFWGHSWQIGKTDEQWKKFEDFVAQFANQPNTWYPSQGELSLWIWARKNVQIAVQNKSSTKVVVKLSRPWLHPYLAAKCPLTFNVPAGVQKVVWQGKEIPVANGRVEIAWAN